jgi:tetratricopeptide (TPR) repeat protein
MLLAAAAHMGAGHFDQAIEILLALRSMAPRHELAIGMLGAVYAQLQAMDSAAECFERVLTLNPDNALARFQLGLLKLDEAQPRAALDIWQRGLREPGDHIVHYHCGLALMKLDLADQARVMFERAAQRMPLDHPLHPQLQQMLQLIGAPS